MKNIILTGLPGSGKSTYGRLLAHKLGRPFVDLDRVIEQAAGLSVKEIFAQHGEAHFRQMEADAAQQMAAESGIVLATGGGTILRDDSANALARNGMIIFIDRAVEEIITDIETAHRPLLQDGAGKLHALAAQRHARYLARAHYTLANHSSIEDGLQTLLAACAPLDAGEYAVIGDPVAHSLSPVIQQAAFAGQGVAARYTAIRVPRGALPAFISGVRVSALRGFNITLPHKQDVMPLLDEVAPEAAPCGAVNTVVHRGGRLCGYNTDMEGLNLSLKQAGHGFTGRRVVLLGAGGAANAVALKACLEKAGSVHIIARSAAKASALAARVSGATGCKVTHAAWTPDALSAACAGCDLLINSTPLGMSGIGADFEDLSFLQPLPAGALVCDLIYSPAETTLLRQARQRGLATLNGLGMLIFQALLAQELFLDTTLDKTHLYHVAHRALMETREELAV